MILFDVNVLIYAYNTTNRWHEQARMFVEAAFSRPSPVLLPWATLLAFIRITTDRRILAEPFTVEEATEIVTGWLELPMVEVVSPTSRHWVVLEQLLTRDQAPGLLVPDAHLAALAIEHGAVLCSTDRDFARFQGLRWINPLQQPDVVNEARPRPGAR